MQLLKLPLRNAAEHGGEDIPALRLLRGIHIAGDIQVVVVAADGVPLHPLREPGDAFPGHDGVHDSFDVAGPQGVVLAGLGKPPGGVHDQDIRVAALLPQHHNHGGDAGSVEDVGGEADDGVDVVLFNQIPADFSFLAAPEENAVRKDNGHDSVGSQVVQIVQQERIVRLPLRSNSEPRVSRIRVLVRRIPGLRIGGIGHHGIHIYGLVRVNRVVLVEVGPVVLQSIAVSGHDVRRQNTPHDQIHAGEVIGVLLQLLGIVHDVVVAARVPGDALTDVDEQGPGTAGRVIDFDFRAVLQVVRDDLGHQKRDLVGGVELTGLFSRVGGKVADQVLVDEAQDVVILFPIHGDVLDEIDQFADRFGPCAGGLPQLGKPCLEGGEDVVEQRLVGGAYQTGEGGQRVGDIVG